MGVGADITANLKYVHTSKVVADKNPNNNYVKKLEKSVLIRRENMVVNNK